MKEKTTKIPDGFKKSYNLWHKEYIEEKKEWAKNPFIAIESHINEDTITDLLAHILETDTSIKLCFLKFLLKNSDNKNITVTDEELLNSEIKTQEWLQDDTPKSRLDILIKISSKCFIIIENKIFDAPEQPKQMERYINGIRKTFNTDEIIAFFATGDGTGKCRTAGKNKEGKNNEVTNLAFYNKNTPSIYGFLDNFRETDTLVRYFLEYLEYTFSSSKSKDFFKNINELNKGELKTELNKVFCVDSQSIQKSLNEYDSPEAFFNQLLKVHILNQYIISLFKKTDKNMINYSYVFSGIKLKKEVKNYSVCFETKYWYNCYYIVITLCSNKKIDKTKYFKKTSSYVETKQNKTNGEYEYSLWLWILDYDVYENYKNKSDDNIIAKKCKKYSKYIDLICNNCMKKIFENICEEINNKQQNQVVNDPYDDPYYIYKKLPY